MKNIFEHLKNYGFFKSENKILNDEDMVELNNQIKTVSKKHDLEKNPFIELCGHNKTLDSLVEKILIDGTTQKVLNEVLGPDYILWGGGAIRISQPNDKGLLFHQDAPGETGLIFLVNDQPNSSTVVFKSSHLVPRICKYLSWNSPKIFYYLKNFLSPMIGKAGEHYFWFYKTWHGRLPNKTNEKYISLFFPFFPQGTDRINLLKETNDKRVDKVSSEYIKKLMNNHKIINQRIDNERLCNKLEKFNFKKFLSISCFPSVECGSKS